MMHHSIIVTSQMSETITPVPSVTPTVKQCVDCAAVGFHRCDECGSALCEDHAMKTGECKACQAASSSSYEESDPFPSYEEHYWDETGHRVY